MADTDKRLSVVSKECLSYFSKHRHTRCEAPKKSRDSIESLPISSRFRIHATVSSNQFNGVYYFVALGVKTNLFYQTLHVENLFSLCAQLFM